MIDIAANRRAQKWTKRELAARILWDIIHPLFALSPRPMWGWRRLMLRLFGARVGRAVHIFPTARISIPWNVSIGDESAVGDRAILYALGPIHIGRQSTISQNAHICAGTHDHRDNEMRLIKTPITIGDGVWICADAFIGPRVSIGDRAIVGARAVVVKDVAGSTIVAGNPCKVVGLRK